MQDRSNIDRMTEIPVWKLCNSYKYTGQRSDLEEYVDCDPGGDISHLKVLNETTIDHQRELTKVLQECSPNYLSFDNHNEGDYLYSLEEGLGLSISIISRGPTARDKEWVRNFTKDIIFWSSRGGANLNWMAYHYG